MPQGVVAEVGQSGAAASGTEGLPDVFKREKSGVGRFVQFPLLENPLQELPQCREKRDGARFVVLGSVFATRHKQGVQVEIYVAPANLPRFAQPQPRIGEKFGKIHRAAANRLGLVAQFGHEAAELLLGGDLDGRRVGLPVVDFLRRVIEENSLHVPCVAHEVVQRLQLLVERARGNLAPPADFPFLDGLKRNGANGHSLEKRGKLVEADDAALIGGLFDPGPDGFEPKGHQFLEMEVALLAPVEPRPLLPKLGQPPPGQIFIGCLESALYLLAANGKPSEISAVTVPVETFSDFLKTLGLVGSHAQSVGLLNWLTNSKNGLEKTVASSSF